MPEKKTAASSAGNALVPAGGGVGGQKVRTLLRKRLGEDVYTSWFNAIEFDAFENGVVEVSVPVKFLRNWIQTHYIADLLECCQAEFKGAEKVEVKLRQPRAAARPAPAPVVAAKAPASLERSANCAPRAMGHDAVGPMTGLQASIPQLPQPGRTTKVGDFEGSPLDPRYTFDTFVVGSSNRVAHAAATRVAESLGFESPGFNPLFIHAPVGLGKSHLLQAAAWEVTRRRPDANVLYLTADGFRYRFVEALRSEDPLSFKEKFRKVDILLIDDLEFMHGAQTETEFDHIVNALLDGGRQLVVASSRPPAQIERLNERMRSRLARGLVTELGAFDYEHRVSVIEMRIAEKRVMDPTFNLSREVVELLADRLKDNGRELEGAVIRLFANWQYVRAPITADVAETVIRDLVQGLEPRRIKIEDILRVITRHFGVSKTDLLSQRRHRSVVWPRQIGMFLAKQMTARSLPEIGRRFGNRDHTTVLHAIRKIDGEINKNPRLRDELEDLKKQLNN
ncbi:MAG: chromosomal replication initiator protein DnaA [Alphaproteobacteria bacterium]|nr:chromosomal replication initiator protein DnaA [Alphaproteobacteria bacterium]